MSNSGINFYCMKCVFFLAILFAGCRKETIPIPENLIETDIYSQEVNDTYILRINLPENYHNTNVSYPVLYQLDGNTTTGSVLSDYDKLIKNNKIREVIVISIDYKNKNNRTRDFTPSSHSSFSESGGAENFLNFFRHKLSPMINQEYKTDTTFGNTLRGHSFGGLFAAYVLLRSQETESVFSNFIIESPSWWWDDNYIFDMETNYSLNNATLPVKAYFAAGEFEAATIKGPFQAFKEKISSRNYPDFQYKFELLDKQTHLDVRENSKGLVEIFGI